MTARDALERAGWATRHTPRVASTVGVPASAGAAMLVPTRARAIPGEGGGGDGENGDVADELLHARPQLLLRALRRHRRLAVDAARQRAALGASPRAPLRVRVRLAHSELGGVERADSWWR